MKVRTNILLTHPSSPRVQMPRGSVSEKEILLRDLGQKNYDFAFHAANKNMAVVCPGDIFN